MQAHHGRSPGLIARTPDPDPPGAAAGLDAAASSLAGVAFFGVLLSCVSRLFSVVSRAFFLLFHGSHTIAAARTPFGPGPCHAPPGPHTAARRAAAEVLKFSKCFLVNTLWATVVGKGEEKEGRGRPEQLTSGRRTGAAGAQERVPALCCTLMLLGPWPWTL